MGDRTGFFYGTLMAPGVLYRVIYGSHTPDDWQKKLTTVRPALLSDFSRHRVKHADFPAIIPNAHGSVRGSYVTGLTDGDIFRLDIFEGSSYTRKKVKVKVLAGEVSLDTKVDETQVDATIVEEVEVETYVWTDAPSDLEEHEWDFEEFKKEKMMAWMGISGHERGDVEVDDGFADVDNAIQEEEERLKRVGQEPHGLKQDPSGGRINGTIAQQLANTAV